ncbi:hypothetical protein [Oryza sativa Japonica Group]|uniref:Uncharacterized protein n=1 Tax=Oryza sativa subsp. japonica TaxID=39947 RepID=Q5Z839_ORYSJ|nr:hypothetical protein [Oryza sativa Japonica Group]
MAAQGGDARRGGSGATARRLRRDGGAGLEATRQRDGSTRGTGVAMSARARGGSVTSARRQAAMATGGRRGDGGTRGDGDGDGRGEAERRTARGARGARATRQRRG